MFEIKFNLLFLTKSGINGNDSLLSPPPQYPILYCTPPSKYFPEILKNRVYISNQNLII